MGWSDFKGDLNVRSSFQVGASNRLVPDIVVNSEDKNLFVIEVKRPDIPLTSEFSSQLKSYMRQLKLDFGILIGQKIQIYYDGILEGNASFTLIDDIEFTRDNEKGLKFIELFIKDNFSKRNLEKHVLEELNKKREIETERKLKEELLSEGYNSKIKEYLKSELLTKYNDSIITKVFNSIEINIEDKLKTDESKRFIRSTSNNFVLKESIKETGKLPIGKYVRKTLNELIKNRLISQSEVEKLQSGAYSKETFDIQFPFFAKENSQFYERVRYWKNPYYINGETYFVCSQWYEVSANNDRPYYERWLKKMKKKN